MHYYISSPEIKLISGLLYSFSTTFISKVHDLRVKENFQEEEVQVIPELEPDY